MTQDNLVPSRFSILPAGIAVAIACILATSGCTDRSSPAATTTIAQSDQQTSIDAKLDKSSSSTESAKSAEGENSNSTKQSTQEVSFDNIKFDMQKEAPFQRTLLTPAIERLNNSNIRIRGYILPSFQQSGLSQF